MIFVRSLSLKFIFKKFYIFSFVIPSLDSFTAGSAKMHAWEICPLLILKPDQSMNMLPITNFSSKLINILH